MTANKIYEIARKHSSALEGMTLSEQFLCTAVRNIYKSYKYGIVSYQQCGRALKSFHKSRAWTRGINRPRGKYKNIRHIGNCKIPIIVYLRWGNKFYDILNNISVCSLRCGARRESEAA